MNENKPNAVSVEKVIAFLEQAQQHKAAIDYYNAKVESGLPNPKNQFSDPRAAYNAGYEQATQDVMNDMLNILSGRIKI